MYPGTPRGRFTGGVASAFYYDFASPDAWLAAERIVDILGEVPEFIPVSLAGLAAGEVGPFRCAAEIDAHFEDVGRRARERNVLAVRPPAVFPQDTEFAMLAATYAKQIGKVVAFSLAAFRQAFAAGRDLSEHDSVFIAGAAAEIHPAALAKGAQLRGTAERLRVATAEAADAGVLDVPAVRIGGRVFHGDAELELAAR
jgi:2-hydroxychromene-2-carboxylate isomerase